MSTTDPQAEEQIPESSQPPKVESSNTAVKATKWFVFYMFLCFGAFLTAVPFVWMVFGSFKTRQEVENPGFVPERWKAAQIETVNFADGGTTGSLALASSNDRSQPGSEESSSSSDAPEVSEWNNYLKVLRLKPDRDGKYLEIFYGRWYFNSVFTSVAITFLQVLTSAFAAYAFSRLVWVGRDLVFFLYLSTMMIPPVVLMIPNFQLMVWLRIVDTYQGLILPWSFTAFGTFLLRQFMMSIPPSLDEAARIDGASHWNTFWEVVMPLTRPGLVALAIFSLLASFQSFFWPLVMLRSQHLFTLPIGLLALDTSYGTQTELILAATVMSVLPLIAIFILLQKQLIKGIQLGAVKG